MTYISLATITNAEALAEYIDRFKAYLSTDDRKELQAFVDSGMTTTVPVLCYLDGTEVPNAKLVDCQGFHYPYDPVPTWRIPVEGDKPQWVTAFPKRESTMAKKGYMETEKTYPVHLSIEIPFVGGIKVLVKRQGKY